MSIPKITECRECGSKSLTWQTHNKNVGQAQNGRLNAHDIQCQLVLGCDECSETLAVVSADKVATWLTEQGQASLSHNGDATDMVAEQHQGEPVALPARKQPVRADYSQDILAEGWNACLNEIAKMGPLYTRADPVEVERLRALLAEIAKRHWSGVDFDLPADLAARIKAVSAGAEPSTPAAVHSLPAKVGAGALREAMENLAVRASVADQPPFFLPAAVRQVPIVMLGGVCVRVTYSGLKWYHDQLINDRWEPLAVEEFDELLTKALEKA